MPRLDAPSFSPFRRGAAACVAIALLFTAGVAGADQEPKPYPACAHVPTETDVGAAKGAFQAGNASFDEADYARAIIYWEDAYRRDCTAHALLLNLARAYELHGERPQAVVALETYLARAPNGPDRDKIERRVDVLKKQIDQDQSPAPVPGDAPAPVTAATEPPGDAPAPAVRGSVASDAPRRDSILPLIVAGSGGALAIAGGIFFAVAWSDLEDVERACGGHRCVSDELQEEGNSARTRVHVGGAVAIGGLAVAGGGLAWYFIERKQGTAAATGFAPLAAPGFFGLGYRGRL